MDLDELNEEELLELAEGADEVKILPRPSKEIRKLNQQKSENL